MTYDPDIIDDIIDYAEGRYGAVEDVLIDLADQAGMFYNEPKWVKQATAAIENGYFFEEKLEEGLTRANA